MALHGPSEVVISMDDEPGGTPVDITEFVTSIGAISIESITEQTNPFGVDSEEHTPVGLAKSADIPIGGYFDDAVDSAHSIFQIKAADRSPASAGRLLTILVATGRTFTVTVHIVKYDVLPERQGLTKFAAIVRQKSAGVWSA
jgi:hypothetical protein